MKLSYEGIGQWCATFACKNVVEGDMVKISDNGTVSTCAAGDVFAGMAVSTAHGGDACSVQLGGMVTAGYSGDKPALGYTALAADGQGGVKSASGRNCMVVDVNEDAQTVTFVL